VTAKHNERVANMVFAGVYPHYVNKVEKKGRTEAELLQVIEWLTGHDEAALEKLKSEQATFTQFFAEATMHPNAESIKGVICSLYVLASVLLLNARSLAGNLHYNHSLLKLLILYFLLES